MREGRAGFPGTSIGQHAPLAQLANAPESNEAAPVFVPQTECERPQAGQNCHGANAVKIGDFSLATLEVVVRDTGVEVMDMMEPYDVGMRKKMEDVAIKEEITLRKGVYVSVVGPQLETKAEYRRATNWGQYMGIVKKIVLNKD